MLSLNPRHDRHSPSEEQMVSVLDVACALPVGSSEESLDSLPDEAFNAYQCTNCQCQCCAQDLR